MKRRRSTKPFKYSKRRRLSTPAQVPALAPHKGPEKKFLDVIRLEDSAPAATFGGNGANAAADVTFLNGLAQGAGDSQRIGKNVTWRSVQMRLNFYPATTSTLAGRFRVVVVYDRQTNGSQPTAANVFETDLGYSPLNLANSARFLVLFDKYTSVIGPIVGGAAGTAPPFATLKLYRKVKLETLYGPTTDAVTSVLTGGIFMYIFNLGFATANPRWDGFMRLRYTDA